jgi:hypothetical protein
MSWVTENKLHREDTVTCTSGATHRELYCEDCDARRMSRATLAAVEGLYRQGRLTQEDFEAYAYVWALLSPHGGQAGWRSTPEDAVVRRIARKLFRLRGLEVPAELEDR